MFNFCDAAPIKMQLYFSKILDIPVHFDYWDIFYEDIR